MAYITLGATPNNRRRPEDTRRPAPRRAPAGPNNAQRRAAEQRAQLLAAQNKAAQAGKLAQIAKRALVSGIQARGALAKEKAKADLLRQKVKLFTGGKGGKGGLRCAPGHRPMRGVAGKWVCVPAGFGKPAAAQTGLPVAMTAPQPGILTGGSAALAPAAAASISSDYAMGSPTTGAGGQNPYAYNSGGWASTDDLLDPALEGGSSAPSEHREGSDYAYDDIDSSLDVGMDDLNAGAADGAIPDAPTVVVTAVKPPMSGKTKLMIAAGAAALLVFGL